VRGTSPLRYRRQYQATGGKRSVASADRPDVSKLEGNTPSFP
jgi:hypothetical protein